MDQRMRGERGEDRGGNRGEERDRRVGRKRENRGRGRRRGQRVDRGGREGRVVREWREWRGQCRVKRSIDWKSNNTDCRLVSFLSLIIKYTMSMVRYPPIPLFCLCMLSLIISVNNVCSLSLSILQKGYLNADRCLYICLAWSLPLNDSSDDRSNRDISLNVFEVILPNVKSLMSEEGMSREASGMDWWVAIFFQWVL